MKRQNEIQAGIFIISALTVLVFSIWILGREREIFSQQQAFYTAFKDVKGLSEGAPVRLGGIKIGRVDKIGFSQDFLDPNVYVTIQVNEEFLERIREDSTVTIETQGLLGDRILTISTGVATQQLLPGHHMRSQEPAELGEVLNKAGVVVDNTVAIAENVNKFISNFNKDTLTHFTSAAKSIADISREIEAGSGFAHQIIYDKESSDSLFRTLSSSAKNINDVTAELKNGNGLLNALIYGVEGKQSIAALTKASSNLADAAGAINDIAAEVKGGSGVLHELIYANESEGTANLIKSLNETARNLKTASESLANGSGTLGALLMDSKLYDNLVEVTDGAKRSYILRHAIKNTLEK